MERASLWTVAGHARHDPGPGLPDRPARLEACLAALEEVPLEVSLVEAGAAPHEALGRVHDERYLEALERICAGGGGYLDADTPVGPDSLEVARGAAGACMGAMDAVWEAGGTGWALVRPPGHHATKDQGMGFCLINNVAVAAAQALAAGADKVAVVDVDVHHGNGTQEIFWRSPEVLYVSLHQWPWYPYYTGARDEIGGFEGEGANVNIPLPAFSGDAAYLSAIARVVLPVLREFRPDALLVSAGFDAHLRDPLSLTEVSTDGFRSMFALLAEAAGEVCGGRMVAVLEGGYDLQALGDSFAAAVEAVTGGMVPRVPSETPPAVMESLEFHRQRWAIA